MRLLLAALCRGANRSHLPSAAQPEPVVGVNGCARVCTGVHGCVRVCLGVHGCVRVFLGRHGCAWFTGSPAAPWSSRCTHPALCCPVRGSTPGIPVAANVGSFWAAENRNYLRKGLLEIFAELRDLQARGKTRSAANKRNIHRLREISIQLLCA